MAAIILFGVLYVRAFYYFPSDEISLPPEVEQEAIAESRGTATEENTPDAEDSSLPAAVIKKEELKAASMRIIIPDIKVSAKIQEVGLTRKGNMAAPTKFSEVGWYKYGAFPGDTGSAVLAGHVNNGIAMPAVFGKLENLQNGADIFIETKEGKRLHFIVTGRKIYPYNSAPEEVFQDKGGKLIKLITCTGSIIKELRTHSERLVITAELQEG